MMGEATVGAMVVWDSDKFDKGSYRRYELEARDEYAQMKELLSRRVQSFEKSSPPDLWVIDGGATLLKLATKILQKAKVNLDVVAIAKEKLDSKHIEQKAQQKMYIYSTWRNFRAKTNDKDYHFCKLRDEP